MLGPVTVVREARQNGGDVRQWLCGDGILESHPPPFGWVVCPSTLSTPALWKQACCSLHTVYTCHARLVPCQCRPSWTTRFLPFHFTAAACGPETWVGVSRRDIFYRGRRGCPSVGRKCICFGEGDEERGDPSWPGHGHGIHSRCCLGSLTEEQGLRRRRALAGSAVDAATPAPGSGVALKLSLHVFVGVGIGARVQRPGDRLAHVWGDKTHSGGRSRGGDGCSIPDFLCFSMVFLFFFFFFGCCCC